MCIITKKYEKQITKDLMNAALNQDDWFSIKYVGMLI